MVCFPLLSANNNSDSAPIHPVANGIAYSADGLDVSNFNVLRTPTTKVDLALRYFCKSFFPVYYALDYEKLFDESQFPSSQIFSFN